MGLLPLSELRLHPKGKGKRDKGGEIGQGGNGVFEAAWDRSEWVMTCLLDLLPTIIMLESFAASIPLMCAGRWGSAAYWFAAGLLNWAVIYGIKARG